jgi:uncharacterized repeat protein (TIGR03803 family)
MFRHPRVLATYLLGCGLAAAGFCGPSRAAGYEVLYAFAGRHGGGYPMAGLIADKAGNLYGTTSAGGAFGDGTIFRLSPRGKETVLYDFRGGSDGAGPSATLLADKSGNLYGTTTSGGGTGCSGFGCGTVFELTPAGVETVLYAFCSAANCADGSNPLASLIMDKVGNLYGTTESGGSTACSSQGCGTVFELAPDGTQTVLHAFAGPDTGDGADPQAGLIRDKAGNLYCTTDLGGTVMECDGDFGCGTIFELAPDGTETILHAFTGGSDGDEPAVGVIMDKAGNLVGTTQYGGSANCSGNGCGTVFSLAPDGTETLYAFDGGDGANPVAGVIEDGSGNIYGTTFQGGADFNGVVFELAPNGAATVLYTFCSEAKCADGGDPAGGLLEDKKGNLFGTTPYGGKGRYGGNGTVFKLTP